MPPVRYCQPKTRPEPSLASDRFMAAADWTMGIRSAREEEATKPIPSFIRPFFFLETKSLFFFLFPFVFFTPPEPLTSSRFSLFYRQLNPNGDGKFENHLQWRREKKSKYISDGNEQRFSVRQSKAILIGVLRDVP